jgi:hypothetical protein
MPMSSFGSAASELNTMRGHQFLGGAGVLEVMIVALRGEDDVAFASFEDVLDAVGSDEHPSAPAGQDHVDLPRAGMPVRFSNAADSQSRQIDGALLADQNEPVLAVGALQAAAGEDVAPQSAR